MLDIVVIGAGFSGLQAAYSAQKAGLSVAVVEARDRVGGKSHSIPLASSRGTADLGAAWVNQHLQPRVWSFIERLGLAVNIVKQRLGRTAVLVTADDQRIEFPYGITPEFSQEEKDNLVKIRDHIQAKSLNTEAPGRKDDSVSLDQYVRDLGASPKTVAMINLWTRVMHGLESTEESAAFFIDYCRTNHGLLAIRADDETGGNYMRLTSGTQSIARGLADLVGHKHIHLSSPVLSIEDKKTHVVVTTRNSRTFEAKKLILSIPSTMYRELQFFPSLPPRLEQIASHTKLGHYNKALVFYDRPWWREGGFNGFIMSFKGPVCVARDTSVDKDGVYGLTCFLNGAPGEAWAKTSPSERRRVTVQQLAEMFRGGEEALSPREFVDQIWKHEEFSRGALVPVPAIGHYTEFADVYGKPVGNIHFAGTEYSRHWKGYIEGALSAGEVAAEEVVSLLGSKKTSELRSHL
ncbi:putative flavin-containing amine oxidase [Plectosphaerella plurivora]|uniref:Amine oxidase n=1 Tax=Plectosphaerella plurivora TaxID=936078 RepID=A0A9P8UVJ4_9PEZI|nr:putative flavin-containing amine oxidase [Plectosphaerella plurivora]